MRSRIAALIVTGCLLVGGGSKAWACFSCSSGYCDDRWARTMCMMTFANGVWLCVLSGNGCAESEEYRLKVVGGEDRRMVSTTFVSLSQRAREQLLGTQAGAVRIVSSRGLFESPVDLLRQYTALPAQTSSSLGARCDVATWVKRQPSRSEKERVSPCRSLRQPWAIRL